MQLLFYRWIDAVHGLCRKMQDKKRDGAADYEYIFCIYSHWFRTVVKTLKHFHPACCYSLLELLLREASTEFIPPWHETIHVNLYACCTYVQYMRAQEWNREKERYFTVQSSDLNTGTMVIYHTGSSLNSLKNSFWEIKSFRSSIL